jgi:hypothetical protein
LGAREGSRGSEEGEQDDGGGEGAEVHSHGVAVVAAVKMVMYTLCDAESE